VRFAWTMGPRTMSHASNMLVGDVQECDPGPGLWLRHAVRQLHWPTSHSPVHRHDDFRGAGRHFREFVEDNEIRTQLPDTQASTVDAQVHADVGGATGTLLTSGVHGGCNYDLVCRKPRPHCSCTVSVYAPVLPSKEVTMMR